MELFGIKFVPLNLPLKHRIQTAVVAFTIFGIVLGGFVGLYHTYYILFYTKYWLPMLLYLFWAWVIDRKTPETGGRRSEWLRRFIWWRYLNDYFPAKLVAIPGVELDKNKNYLFCCFPHGVLTFSVLCAFGNSVSGFNKLFPHHKPYVLTLGLNFLMPFVREIWLTLGMVSVSAKSLSWILSSPNGGNVAVLSIGGASESLNCRPGEYKLCLKNRRGFVKYALKCGSPLVPVFLFGENNLYNQVSNPQGSLLRTFQENMKKIFGIAPVIANGRGLFQYSFGMLPFDTPLTTVIGKPINVEKNENPTKKELDELHQNFVDSLINLFEENKHKYIIDAHKYKLIIE